MAPQGIRAGDGAVPAQPTIVGPRKASSTQVQRQEWTTLPGRGGYVEGHDVDRVEYVQWRIRLLSRRLHALTFG